jgi:hypothetical protein
VTWPELNNLLTIDVKVIKVGARRAIFDAVITDEKTGEMVASRANGRAVIA